MTVRLLLVTLLMATGLMQARPAASSESPSMAMVLSSSESYLGSIEYHGGLLERGRLELSTAAFIKYLRFEIPSHCKADIFEAGTTTEGTDDLAERTRTSGVFAINEGRGIRARGIFLSLNGANEQNCHVLIFGRDQLDNPTQPTDPTAPSGHAITCFENQLNFPVVAQLNNNGHISEVLFQARRTSILAQPLRGDAPLPLRTIEFDRDISANSLFANYSLLSTHAQNVDCATAPRYRFVSILGTPLIDLFKVN